MTCKWRFSVHKLVMQEGELALDLFSPLLLPQLKMSSLYTVAVWVGTFSLWRSVITADWHVFQVVILSQHRHSGYKNTSHTWQRFKVRCSFQLCVCVYREGAEDGDSQGDGSSQPDTISIASRTSQNTVDSDKVRCAHKQESLCKSKYIKLLNSVTFYWVACCSFFYFQKQNTATTCCLCILQRAVSSLNVGRGLAAGWDSLRGPWWADDPQLTQCHRVSHAPTRGMSRGCACASVRSTLSVHICRSMCVFLNYTENQFCDMQACLHVGLRV